MKPFLKGLVAAIPALSVPVLAHGGAWVQEPGTAYLRLSTGFLATDERFDAEGERVQWDTSGGGFRDSRYSDAQVYAYAEVGIARGWNVVAIAGWSRLVAEQPSAVFKTRGFNDMTLGVKHALWTPVGKAVSIQGALTFPTGYDAEEYPALGSDVTDLSLTGQAGAATARLWSNLELEYRLRGGVFRDQLRGALSGGWSAHRRVVLRGEVRGGVAVGATRDAPSDLRFDPTTVDPNTLDVAGTVSVIAVPGLAVEGEFRTPLAGENTLAGTRWTLAVATSPAWSWKR